MNRSTGKWLAAAFFLAAAGLVTVAAVMTAYHWDFSRLSTVRFETNVHEISEPFSSICVHTETSDVLFAVSDDGACRVVCLEAENLKHSVSVQNGTLTVSLTDGRKWHERIGFSFHPSLVTVYLPGTEYASIVIDAGTGDVELPLEMKAGSADISLSTGDISISSLSADSLSLSVSTGGISVSGVTCSGDLKACAVTGDVHMTNVTCRNLFSSGSTSDISLKNVIAAGKISIERSTGDVLLDGSDAAGITVKTSTGSVTGSLLTEKVFAAETSTGKISVPETTAGGTCEIVTSTGNILFQ